MATPRWITAAEVEGGVIPAGGTTDQVLAKESNTDYDLKWADSGGGGSFLSAFTARVDPSGSDETGTFGDLSKPFLTVQGALDAIAALAAGESPLDLAVVDIGINTFLEDVTLDNTSGTWPFLIFKGVTNNGNPDQQDPYPSCAFQSLTITGDGNLSNIRLKDCFVFGGGIFTDSPLVLLLDSANMGGGTISSTHSGGSHLTIGSMYGTGAFIASVNADDTGILVFGVTADAPNGATISSANDSVTIANSGQAPEGTTFGNPVLSVFSVNAPDGTVTVNDSLIKDVTCNTLHLTRSKAIGTVTAASGFTDDQGPYAYFYDVGFQGGAQGTIYLNPVNGGNGGALPAGFVVTGAILEIITPLDSASHLATVALSSGETDGDLQAATLVSGAPWSTAGLKRLTPLFKTTGGGFTSDNPVIVVAVEDLTAGQFKLHIEGYIDL